MEANRRQQRLAAVIDLLHSDGFAYTTIAGAYLTSQLAEPRG